MTNCFLGIQQNTWKLQKLRLTENVAPAIVMKTIDCNNLNFGQIAKLQVTRLVWVNSAPQNCCHKIVVTKLLSPNCCHQTVLIKLFSPNGCHQNIVTTFMSPNGCHQIIVTKLMSPNYCNQAYQTLFIALFSGLNI